MRTALFEATPVGDGKWSASGRDRFAEETGNQFGGYILGSVDLRSDARAIAQRRPDLGDVYVRVARRKRPADDRHAMLAGAQRALLLGSEGIGRRRRSCLRSGHRDAGGASRNSSLRLDCDARRSCAGVAVALDGRSADGDLVRSPSRARIPSHTRRFDLHRLGARTDDGEPVDHARLAMFADLFPPRVFYGLPGRRPSSTVMPVAVLPRDGGRDCGNRS